MKKILICLLCWPLLFNIVDATESNKLTVLLDWYPNPDHAPLFVAEQQGLFKQQGLAVELIAPADATSPPKLVAAGTGDIAITYEPQFLQQIDSGLPVKLAGILIDKPLACMLTLKSSHIAALTDLKGKRIGTNIEGGTDIILKTMLAKAGLSLDTVQMIVIPYDLSQALLTYNIDAAMGMMRNYQIPQLEQSGHPVYAFYPEDYGVPTYSELVFIINQNKINDTRIPKFLAALAEATQYLKQHPEETWKEFAKRYPENNNEATHHSWLVTVPYFADNPTKINTKNWETFASFMQKNGLIKTVPPLSSITGK